MEDAGEVEVTMTTLRHTVTIITKRGPVVIWDTEEPCPWHLQRVIRDWNWREQGLAEVANKVAKETEESS
jgi:hypothetical protein